MNCLEKKPCTPAHWKKTTCQHACSLYRYSMVKQYFMKSANIINFFVENGFDENDLKKVLQKVEPAPSNEFYRNKLMLRLEQDKVTEKITAGLYAKNSHKLINIFSCKLHVEGMNDLARKIVYLINQFSFKVIDENGDMSAPGLRNLVLRYSFRQKKFLLVIVTSKRRVPGLAELASLIEKKYGSLLTAIVQNINSINGDGVLGNENRFLLKNEEMIERYGKFSIPVGPSSFTQTNPMVAHLIYKRVNDILGQEEFSLGVEAHSGVGLYSQFLAQKTEHILNIEENPNSIMDAKNSCEKNKIHNIFHSCSLAHEGLAQVNEKLGRPSWLIVNPPRKGLLKETREIIAQLNPAHFFYISCSPKTLARDLAELFEKNKDFVLESVEPFDMFPHTEHIECLVYIKSKKALSDTEKVSKNILSEFMQTQQEK